MAMGIGSKDKASLRSGWEALEAALEAGGGAGGAHAAALAALRPKYRL
jgi:hypothetical protein